MSLKKRSRSSKQTSRSSAREGEEEEVVERESEGASGVTLREGDRFPQTVLALGGTRSCSHMPVRGEFAAASAAGSVSSGSVRASVTQNSRHGGAQEKQEAKR